MDSTCKDGKASRTGRAARPLKVLIVATEGPPVLGGIAQSIRFLQNGLRDRGHTVDVLAFPRVPRLVLGEVRLSGMTAHLLRRFRLLAGYDVVNVHGVTPTVSDVGLLAILAVRAARRRPALVYTHHVDVNFGPIGPMNAVYNALHHRLSARADERVTTTCAGLAALGDRGLVIPFGVDGDRYFDPAAHKQEPFTVIYVGQFRPWKGVPILLDAVSRLSGVRLILAGQGPEADRYRKLAAGLHVDVEFQLGVDNDTLRSLYDRAHVIVLPSTSHLEGFGIVLLEGMARGCVPVASDLAGVREVLGRIGFTFPPGSASQLATLLARLRDDGELRAQVARRARQRAGAFTWERTVTEYERLFLEVTHARELRDDIRHGERAAAVEAFLAALKTETAATYVSLEEASPVGLTSVHGDGGRRDGGAIDQELVASLVRRCVQTHEAVAVNAIAGGFFAVPVNADGHERVLLVGRSGALVENERASWRQVARHLDEALAPHARR